MPRTDDGLLIKASWLIDGTGAAAREGGAVLIRDGRIAAVGGAEMVEQEASRAEVAEYPGKALLPGLVDAHTHLSLAGDGRTYEQMAAGDSDEMMALVAIR